VSTGPFNNDYEDDEEEEDYEDDEEEEDYEDDTRQNPRSVILRSARDIDRSPFSHVLSVNYLSVFFQTALGDNQKLMVDLKTQLAANKEAISVIQLEVAEIKDSVRQMRVKLC
jgi:hypothetical protein